MALDIGEAVEEGVRRTVARNGLLIAAAFFLINLAAAFTGLRSGTGMGMMYQPFGGNPLTLALLGIVVSLISVAVSIAALRTFVTDETSVIPDYAFKRNMGSALLHTIVGGIIFGILVAVGFILLIVPGVYILTALFFWTIYVAVEDQNFYEAMQSSWDLTKGNKWRVLGLLIVIALINILLSVVGALASLALENIGGLVILQVLSAFGGVFALAAQAQAYTQLEG